MHLLCPVCYVPLRARLCDGVALDVCGKCAGVWMDSGELRRLVQAGLDALQRVDMAALPEPERTTILGGRRCPECDAALERYRYAYSSPIELDRCDRCCGIWVDGGELMAIADHLSGADPTPDQRAAIELAKAQGEADREQRRLRAALDLFRYRIPFSRLGFP